MGISDMSFGFMKPLYPLDYGGDFGKCWSKAYHDCMMLTRASRTRVRLMVVAENWFQ